MFGHLLPLPAPLVHLMMEYAKTSEQEYYVFPLFNVFCVKSPTSLFFTYQSHWHGWINLQAPQLTVVCPNIYPLQMLKTYLSSCQICGIRFENLLVTDGKEHIVFCQDCWVNPDAWLWFMKPCKRRRWRTQKSVKYTRHDFVFVYGDVEHRTWPEQISTPWNRHQPRYDSVGAIVFAKGFSWELETGMLHHKIFQNLIRLVNVAFAALTTSAHFNALVNTPQNRSRRFGIKKKVSSMGNSLWGPAPNNVTEQEGEVTLVLPNGDHVLKICSQLFCLNIPVVAITPHFATTHLIWILDPSKRVATMVNSGLLGPDVKLRDEPWGKGNEMRMADDPNMTFLQARNWHEELRARNMRVIAVSPPSELRAKYVFLDTK